tara:strand:+ start:776 stop:934 length:159 start_codon:yes stop_codon:yes gene_type:complete
MSAKQPSHKEFHLTQARRLTEWMTPMKDYIIQEEIDEISMDTLCVKTDLAPA